ncbi:MFS transporter [Brachybacterium squillarum]|uniref:MFS transporter n=1 Tax=Brachybacterium squillarum TaxID=661979 RepID=UPI00026299AD|nr:MFS transporter [Brachybacterium squillarum]
MSAAPEQARATGHGPGTTKALRAFLAIWLAQMIARLGNGLTAFGMAIYVYQQSGRALDVSLVTLAAFLPAVLLEPFAGVVADRYDRRLLMILSDTGGALGLFALLGAMHLGVDSLTVICVCVGVNSAFASVMDPAYRSTVTDLLSPDQYARAGGLVQLASAVQFLLAPALAGALLIVVDVSVLVLIDALTSVVTATAMAVIWRQIRAHPPEAGPGFWADLRFGIAFLRQQHGVLVLMVLLSLVTFALGVLQTLLTPLLLDLSDEHVAGYVRSLAAIGLLVSSVVIGALNPRGRMLRMLCLGLAAGGAAVIVLGATTSIIVITIAAFSLFLTLPPMNTGIEVLARSAIPNHVQGRVWGLMGTLSQLGYVAAYALSGLLADDLFTPSLRPGGALADSVGAVLGTGPTRGIGLMFILMGLLMFVLALVIPRVRSVREIEHHYRSSLSPSPHLEGA